MASALVVAAALRAHSSWRFSRLPCEKFSPRLSSLRRRMFSSRIARDYMRLARAPIQKTAEAADFSIKAALEALREQPELQKSETVSHFGINAALEALREKPQREGDGEFDGERLPRPPLASTLAKCAGPLYWPSCRRPSSGAGRPTPVSGLLRSPRQCSKNRPQFPQRLPFSHRRPAAVGFPRVALGRPSTEPQRLKLWRTRSQLQRRRWLR